MSQSCETLALAKTIKYVRPRGNGHEYHRRVPQDVIGDPAGWQRGFDGQKIFKRSLGTTDETEVLRIADKLRLEYERRLAIARGQPDIEVPEPNLPPLSLTSDLLAEISDQIRKRTRKPWITAYLLAEQDQKHAIKLDEVIYERELFAEERKAKLMQHIDRILSGELPMPSRRRSGNRSSNRSSPTLRETLERYVSERSLRPKTKRDALKSLELFEKIVGNKRLIDLQREDFATFLSTLAKMRIGGKSPGSIERGIAPATVERRLKSLRS